MLKSNFQQNEVNNMPLILNRRHYYYDETQEPWYALWCHYEQLCNVKTVIQNDDHNVWFEGIKARSRAIKVASTVLIKQFPEFFQWIEWSLDDLTGNGFPIADDYIDYYWGDAGIPEDFKFKFNSTQQDFEDFYEIKGAYA
jgi:hypothetical protein